MSQYQILSLQSNNIYIITTLFFSDIISMILIYITPIFVLFSHQPVTGISAKVVTVRKTGMAHELSTGGLGDGIPHRQGPKAESH